MTILVWKTDGSVHKFDFDQVTLKDRYGSFRLAESDWDDSDFEDRSENIVKIEVIL